MGRLLMREMLSSPASTSEEMSSRVGSDDTHVFPIHEHPLSCRRIPFRFQHSYGSKNEKFCSVCKKICPVLGRDYFDCQDCRFYVHPECAEIIPDTSEIVTEGGDKLIHEHRMQFLLTIPKNSSVRCSECGGFCKGKVYGCKPCFYYIHPGCRPVQTGGAVQHDRCHPCDLIGYMVQMRDKNSNQTTLVSSCNVCGQRGERGRVIFHCNKCNFNLHSECINMSPATPSNIKVVPDSTEYYSHEHPLILYNINIPTDHRVECRICGKYCSNSVYGCLPCAIFLHPSCAELKLPQEIQHFYHSCPLTLYTKPDVLVAIQQKNHPTHTSNIQSSPCKACKQNFPARAFYYGCHRCLFVMDIDCTLLPILAALSSQRTHQYRIFHGHPLSLSEEKNGGKVNCFVCGKGCNSRSATYSCGRSTCRDVFIDESCIELPQKIYHPFHLYHPLFLLEQTGSPARCNACRKDTRAIAYICQHDNCSFFLDIICGKVRLPAIKSEAHSHLLHFRERTDDQLKCNACDKTCESSIFSCLYCDWNLHYTCGPLPIGITYKYDEDSLKDSLVVTNALAEHEDEMDDEFYCDVCEKQRDPLIPTYQCTDHCNFVAEIGCVISEVISLLKGDRGDHVELRDPFGQHGKLIMPPKNTIEDQMMQNKEDQSEPTLRLSKILKSLNEDESKELTRVLEARKIRETFSAEERFFNDPEKDNVLRCSDKDYTQFIKFLDRGIEISIDQLRDGSGSEVLFRSLDQKPPYVYFAIEEEVVNVGDHYKSARTFAHILRQLISKHGDISAASTLSPNVKLFFLNMLCGCIYSMRNTKVVDITTDLLLIWWTILRTCQVAGFQVQSVFDHLKRVADAFFGLYVGKQADKVERDLAELKRKRDCIASSTKRDLVDECLREASVLKQGKAITERLWELI